ncbi:MAG: hypothetical protein ACPGVH_09600 [Chitinophagales bacterium]
MDLERLEKELKKRWQIPYAWKGTKQTNELDAKTSFIYTTYSYKRLLERSKKLNENEKNYAYNRWYNFWSAKAVEYIFSKSQKIRKNEDKYHKTIDFWLNDTPFDHKTSVFPKKFNLKFQYYLENKKELIDWFYKNQSQQQRKHLENRLFVVLYNSNDLQHWKMKAEIALLQKHISDYLENFEEKQLISLDFDEKRVFSDVLFIKK